jgi:hypothetical protein
VDVTALAQDHRARTYHGEVIVVVVQGAAVEREATAADAAGETATQIDERRYPVIEVCRPVPRQSFPVLAGGGSGGRQTCQCDTDFGQGDAQLLASLDHRYSPEHISAVTSLVAAGSGAANQAFALVEVQGRHRHAAACRDLANRQPINDGFPLYLNHG